MAGTRRKPGAMGPFVEGYREWLLERGYSLSTVVHSLIALGHLGRWMEQNEIGVGRLDDAAIRTFVAGQVRTRAGRLPYGSVAPLIAYLRAEGAVSLEPAGAMTAVDELVACCRTWLCVERGLAPETVRCNVELARRFLAGISGEPRRVVPIAGRM